MVAKMDETGRNTTRQADENAKKAEAREKGEHQEQDKKAGAEQSEDPKKIDPKADFQEDPERVKAEELKEDQVIEVAEEITLEMLESLIKKAVQKGIPNKDLRDMFNKTVKTEGGRNAGKKGKVVLLNKDFDKDKMPTQMKGILECLRDNGSEMQIEDLISSLDGYITTRQTNERIFQFYRKRLSDEEGYIKIEG